ncbi:MAG: Gfo/Idh/MocA family oxidoreductase [Planctomycetaceae bacterium]|nr:Gfo/Idh/MocA family oxidoreductase [Planctomycetaceae bacterium]
MEIRWGIIGCGDIAQKRVADAIGQQPGSQLLAACRRNQEKLSDFCQKHQIPKGYSEANELLSDPEIDAVYLATPVNLHCTHAVTAAKQGKHVLVEKPMAMSVAECEQMVEAARQARVNLGVAYYRRCYPSVSRISQILQTGEIGRPFAVSAVVSNGFGRSADSNDGWRGDPRIGGGGALMDVGSHRIDLFVKLFGDACSVKSCLTRLDTTYEAENSISMICMFENGVQATLQSFFGPQPSLDQFRVVGFDGHIDIENLNQEQVRITTSEGTRVESHAPAENLHLPLIDDFVQAIRDHRPPVCCGVEGMKTSQIMAQAYQDGNR